MRRTNAFTLIELMVVIAIISLLMLVGIPAYEKYKLRANISDGAAVLAEYKKAIAILWNTDGNLPSENTVLPGGPVDLPFNKTITHDLSKNIESLTLFSVNKGVVIKLVYAAELFPDAPVNNRSLCLGAKPNLGSVTFNCGNFSTNVQSSSDIGLLDANMLPSNCNFDGVSSWLTNN
jgi:prepilin-type N-terminal cleavage/methylation domain-containing protein